MSGYRHIRLEFSPSAVATLSLARPERLNALDADTVAELRAALDEVRGSLARCLLLAGEGRGLSGGADLASGTAFRTMSARRWRPASIR